MNISGLNFNEYDKNNEQHRKFMKLISNLPQVENEFFNYEEYVKALLVDPNNKAYIVSTFYDVLAIMCLLKQDEKYYLSYIMHPDKNIESMETFVLDLFTYYFFQRNSSIEELSLQENRTNIGFKVVASRCGYDYDNSKYVRKRKKLI